jgi:hypothetical protein
VREGRKGEVEAALRAFEVAGEIDERRQLHVKEPLPIAGPSRVRIIILVPDQPDVDEATWLESAAVNPAFSFLREPREDVYTVADGKPFHDQR